MDGGAAVYAYDGEGRRMKKTVGSETTYYFYGPGGLLCEFSTSNAISSATAASSTDKTLYRTSDKLGSAVLVINSSGLVIENNRTLPYGEAWQAESTPSTNDKKFTSYQRDFESALDYAMNRYDANTSGRFMSADKGPASLHRPSSLNRYPYGMNDPINHIDPDGNVSRPAPPANGTAATPQTTFRLSSTEPEPEPLEAPIDPECIQKAILEAVSRAGLNLNGFRVSGISIAGENGSKRTYLTLEGDNTGAAWYLRQEMCDRGFYSSGPLRCNSERAGDQLIGAPHEGYDSVFRAPSVMGSLNVNMNSLTDRIEIDVDAFNPASGGLGALLHVVAQVLPHLILGTDNMYHCD
jgi:RHS repeat-associated protein